jgi:phosphatidylglycerol:prolipoprotein diacylglycerol transferase
VKPVLFHLGSFPVRSYGVAMAVAFIVGILIARARARRAGIHPDVIVDLAFFVIIASIVGARAAYVIVHWSFFSAHPAEAFRIWDGGLAQYGGIVLGLITGLLFFRVRGIDPWKGADVVAPSLALGIAIGRIGCFLNGCCFGIACDLPWGVRFPPGSHAALALPGTAVHPTEIYASIAAVAIFFVLLAFDRRKPFDGFLLWLFVILLAVYRFAIDPIRYYEQASYVYRGPRFSITSNQVMGAVLIVIAALFMAYLNRTKRRAPSP